MAVVLRMYPHNDKLCLEIKRIIRTCSVQIHCQSDSFNLFMLSCSKIDIKSQICFFPNVTNIREMLVTLGNVGHIREKADLTFMQFKLAILMPQPSIFI